MTDTLKSRIQEDVKTAMRAKDKPRLAVLRMVTAALKQREVDERIELDDEATLQVLVKLVKQRKDSIEQYSAANRADLADQERAELELIEGYMPQALGADELNTIVGDAISETGAASIKDMGKVMAWLRPKVQGRADMGALSATVKTRLNAS
ncbi:MAG: GatB/YqeY domain-containing protein [Pseudomonadota bacterium]